MSSPEKRAATLIALSALGIEKVRAEYSGSGDEGCLDDAVAFIAETPVEVVPSLITAASEILESALEESFSGWENDEGAEGVVTWTMADDKIHIDHEVYRTVTDHEEADL
jgi:hypothetical protein